MQKEAFLQLDDIWLFAVLSPVGYAYLVEALK